MNENSKLMLLVIAVFTGSVICWIVFSHQESNAYLRLTGRNVPTFDAMFVQLRVVEPYKSQISIDERGFAVLSEEPFPCGSDGEGAIYVNDQFGKERTFICDGLTWVPLEGNMYQIKRTDDEINEALNNAADGEDNGSKFPGMSYENGVRAFADWVFGNIEDAPFDE